MTNTELQTIRRAITLLSSLINGPQECVSVPWQSPVRTFVQEYLTPDADADLTSEELWTLFQEVAKSGGLPPMRRSAFLRELPTVMEAVFRLRKCHHIERNSHRVRGFRGVGIRMDAGKSAVSQNRTSVPGGRTCQPLKTG